ncbi:hypothetical protein WICMUC_001096 [Wickerhamomyces mucosus]|uniref:TLC domain-containing protein n=1 Tax=Wickerhamomyces mucosus TaxID=1378264 RepID=A0A9P8PX95_9ASCO|nr:hypothetical protein WICMUC_001096 [Wickerhamomyces mucosus]
MSDGIIEVLSALKGPIHHNPLAPYINLPLVDEYIKPLVQSHECISRNIHFLIFIILFYQIIFISSSIISPLIFSNTFKDLSKKTRLDFHIRIVSLVQSILILIAIIPLFNDPIMENDRVFGHTPYSELVTSAALGYFVWDSIMSLIFVKYFGIQFLIHGLVSSLVFYIGMTPFIQYYAGIFILFELSTPFLNLRWFGLKFPKLFPETFNLINNAILILIFFFVRICYGWFQAFKLFNDFYSSYQDERFITLYAIIVAFCYNVLGVLNFWWFYRMAKVAFAIISDMISGTNNHDENKKDI